MIVDSKSQSVELDNSTIELHVPSKRTESLQSYCSVDFDFLALMRIDMTFEVKLRDDSSFEAVPKFNRELGRVSNFNQSI